MTNVNPPITETTDVSLSVKHQMENPANFPTPSRTPPLIEFQKVLRERFPTPFITLTEKKARRDVIRTLRSQRRPQLSSWNVVETRSPARSRNLRKQLFVDSDSETPMKSLEPTCVGVAAIRGIIPFSSGSFFSLTPPITESTDACLSVKDQVENQANFPTPSRIPPLIEFQKVLRERFPTPFITPTEKKARRDVIRTLRSHRRPQLSSWNVVETRSPARSRNLRKQLFVDSDSLSNSAEATPPSQLDDRRQTTSWKQVRLQIPPCWADLIGNHIKENHPYEKLRYQEEASARWPIVKIFCTCAQSKRD